MRSRDETIDDDVLLNEVRTADLLNLSIRTLQAWRVQGRGPSYVRAGRAVRYRKSDLKDWIETNLVVPATASCEIQGAEQ